MSLPGLRATPRASQNGTIAIQNRLAAQYGSAIEDEYVRMDATIAAVLPKLRPEDTLLILSDHGFHGYSRGLHVNQWLRGQGLLTLKGGATSSEQDFFLDVDWSKTKAYALGTGQIYLNRAGREAGGIVSEQDAPAVEKASATAAPLLIQLLDTVAQ